MPSREAAGSALARSLELYAEQVGDPTSIIYQRFFAKHPDAKELFGSDEGDYTKFRMMERLILMIMELADGSLAPEHCAYWMTDHLAWGVSQAMVFDMLDIIIATVRDGVGERWTADMEVGWQGVMVRMMPALLSHM